MSNKPVSGNADNVDESGFPKVELPCTVPDFPLVQPADHLALIDLHMTLQKHVRRFARAFGPLLCEYLFQRYGNDLAVAHAVGIGFWNARGVRLRKVPCTINVYRKMLLLVEPDWQRKAVASIYIAPPQAGVIPARIDEKNDIPKTVYESGDVASVANVVPSADLLPKTSATVNELIDILDRLVRNAAVQASDRQLDQKDSE